MRYTHLCTLYARTHSVSGSPAALNAHGTSSGYDECKASFSLQQSIQINENDNIDSPVPSHFLKLALFLFGPEFLMGHKRTNHSGTAVAFEKTVLFMQGGALLMVTTVS